MYRNKKGFYSKQVSVLPTGGMTFPPTLLAQPTGCSSGESTTLTMPSWPGGQPSKVRATWTPKYCVTVAKWQLWGHSLRPDTSNFIPTANTLLSTAGNSLWKIHTWQQIDCCTCSYELAQRNCIIRNHLGAIQECSKRSAWRTGCSTSGRSSPHSCNLGANFSDCSSSNPLSTYYSVL